MCLLWCVSLRFSICLLSCAGALSSSFDSSTQARPCGGVSARFLADSLVCAGASFRASTSTHARTTNLNLVPALVARYSASVVFCFVSISFSLPISVLLPIRLILVGARRNRRFSSPLLFSFVSFCVRMCVCVCVSWGCRSFSLSVCLSVCLPVSRFRPFLLPSSSPLLPAPLGDAGLPSFFIRPSSSFFF